MKRLFSLLASASVVAAIVACNSDTVDLGGGATQPTEAATDAGTSTTNPTTGGDSAAPTPKVPNPGGGVFNFEAFATTAVPAGAKAVVVWSVSSGSPDYTYAYGGGSTSGTQVFVSFSATPPVEALNAGKLGIGIVGIVDSSSPISEGKLTKADLDSFQFLSGGHAVIYRATNEVHTIKGWEANFPQGYACGRCVRADSGFDTFEVVDCKEIEVEPAATADVCNWT